MKACGLAHTSNIGSQATVEGPHSTSIPATNKMKASISEFVPHYYIWQNCHHLDHWQYSNHCHPVLYKPIMAPVSDNCQMAKDFKNAACCPAATAPRCPNITTPTFTITHLPTSGKLNYCLKQFGVAWLQKHKNRPWTSLKWCLKCAWSCFSDLLALLKPFQGLFFPKMPSRVLKPIQIVPSKIRVFLMNLDLVDAAYNIIHTMCIRIMIINMVPFDPVWWAHWVFGLDEWFTTELISW